MKKCKYDKDTKRNKCLNILPLASSVLHALNFRVCDVSLFSVLQYVFKHAEYS